MADVALFGIPPGCAYRVLTVRCPQQAAEATVTAATWEISRGRWSGWTVVDCTLQPAGWIGCEMRCLVQLEPAMSRTITTSVPV
jgi:hypothetical protein